MVSYQNKALSIYHLLLLHLFASTFAGDEVGNVVRTYAENESHNPSTKASLKEFAGYYCAVQDYRDAEVNYSGVYVLHSD